MNFGTFDKKTHLSKAHISSYRIPTTHLLLCPLPVLLPLPGALPCRVLSASENGVGLGTRLAFICLLGLRNFNLKFT